MPDRIETNSSHETHPYNSLQIPADTKTLIVGTAPPPRFSLPRPPHEGPRKGYDADFYYGSYANWLWVYLEKAAGEELFAEPGTPEAIKEDTENLMQDFLRRHQLWMRDILQTYRRKPGKETSASDQDIDTANEGTTFLKFVPILEKNIGIQKIVFTSEQAAKWFFKALETETGEGTTKHYQQKFSVAHKDWKAMDGNQRYANALCTFDYDGRSINFYIAPSPSGAAGSKDVDSTASIYKTILF
jgi:hypothetical protein